MKKKNSVYMCLGILLKCNYFYRWMQAQQFCLKKEMLKNVNELDIFLSKNDGNCQSSRIVSWMSNAHWYTATGTNAKQHLLQSYVIFLTFLCLYIPILNAVDQILKKKIYFKKQPKNEPKNWQKQFILLSKCILFKSS